MVGRDVLMVFKRWPEGIEAMHALNKTFAESGLSRELLELVRIRTSLLNRCEFCIDLHRGVALDLGIPLNTLADLEGWSESSSFSPEQRAALALTDALTRPSGRIDDGLRSELAVCYTQKQITQLGFAIGAINAWNRIAITDQALTSRGET
ncbi:MAG: carboxymuconolactone decarboxylase family protein [Actinomycetia bacterium]|nr:carboxymuconolactone decarboxylase family protein [Actinomycetes bacterium]